MHTGQLELLENQERQEKWRDSVGIISKRIERRHLRPYNPPRHAGVNGCESCLNTTGKRHALNQRKINHGKRLRKAADQIRTDDLRFTKPYLSDQRRPDATHRDTHSG